MLINFEFELSDYYYNILSKTYQSQLDEDQTLEEFLKAKLFKLILGEVKAYQTSIEKNKVLQEINEQFQNVTIDTIKLTPEGLLEN